MPQKGKATFIRLKENFGYAKAATIFNKVTGEDFLDRYSDSLALDSEGVPSYQSIINNPVVRNYLGADEVALSLNKGMPVYEDTAANASLLVNKAAEINKNNEYPEYIAYVDYTDDGRITIKFGIKNAETVEIAESQMRIQKLNEKVSEILGSAGVSLSFLSSIETAVGRVGLTNFNHAKDIADNFTGLIQIANNMEGTVALSEEFSHLLVGLYNDSPLIQRSLVFFNDEGRARAVLGDEYDTLFEYYDGNTALIAEEVVGQLLREQLLNKLDSKSSTALIDRAANYIKKLYKGINPGYYQNEIDHVAEDLGTVAKEILERKRTFTKEDIAKARRDATFNALSERAQAQAKVLKTAVQNAYKASYLQENLDEKPEGQRTQKSRAHITAARMEKEVQKKINQEETMAAISAYLDIAIADVNELFEGLAGVENLSVEDKFRVLRNALYLIQSYAPTLEDLRKVTTAEFLEDEGISSQEFMVSDNSNALEEFETDAEEETVDTSGMSTSQIQDKIVEDSSDLELSDDESYYINKKTGEKYKRVTSIIDADKNAGDPFDPTNPWSTPSTNVGTGVDEFVRDFIAGRITQDKDGNYKVDGKNLSDVYPNATERQLNMFAHQLNKFLEEQKGITFIPRDVTVSGTIKTEDANRQVHIVNVAGTLDLLGYDADGNWYIYDMKTHHGKTIGESKKAKWARQTSLYKRFLEHKYGINIKSLKIIPIKVEYPAPEGTEKGHTRYTVKEEKPDGYNGRKGNQLYAEDTNTNNGPKEFKEAKPFLEDTIELSDRELNIDYKKLSGDATGGLGDGTLAVREAIKALQDLYSEFITRFSEIALPEFVKFLKPFVGDNVKIIEKKGEGNGFQRWYERGETKEVSIEQVIKNASSDVTMMQQLFNSIADNPNTLLQIFDKVIKRAKDEKRLKVIEKAREIIALGKEYELKGVTDYEKFYEKDRQNYVCHLVINGKDYSYDKSAYEESKARFEKDLDAIYGQFPEVGSEEWKQKNEARKRWVNGDGTTPGHQITIKDESGEEKVIPNPEYYPSRYSSFTDTEKEFYDKWLALKAELDEVIGPGHTFLTNTIKIRKNGIERLRGVFSGTAITDFVEGVKSKVMKSFDDNQNYASGIMGFTGEEIMQLPLYYINAKGNPSDISTDMIGTLVAYAEMAYNYEAMSSIASPLEIGRYLVGENMAIQNTRGGKPVRETFTVGGRTHTNPIKVPTAASNLMKAMNDLFESKIYGRFLKDSGEIGNVDVNKAANLLLKLGSTVQLGFNVFAWLANAATGAAMQRIEAIAGEFFNYKELVNADKEFFKAMGHYVGDIGQRVQVSKLHLFDEMFDVRQSFKTEKTHIDFNNRNLLTRIFGPGIQYIGQDSGDHWLYNRTAIAVALRYKLKDKNGNSISLWDALETVPINAEHPEYGAELKLKEGVTKEDGTEFTKKDISDLSGRMRYINQHMFGIYNEEDSIGARRTLWGRFLMQYRDWIPAQFRYRFGTRTTNLEKGGEVEGYYRTTARFVSQIYKDVIKGQQTLSQIWSELDDYDRRNVIRARTEILQWVAVCALVALLGRLDDDKDRPWAIRAAKYLATREKTELGALVPISMPKEMLTIAKSPFANTSVISDLWNLGLLLNPMNYMDEIQSGDYKGHSSAYRAFMRSPLTLWYRTFKRTAHPEKAEQFYKSNK